MENTLAKSRHIKLDVGWCYEITLSKMSSKQ